MCERSLGCQQDEIDLYKYAAEKAVERAAQIDTQKREAQLPASIDILYNRITDLAVALNILEDRLRVVSRQEPIDDHGNVAEATEPWTYYDRVSNQNYRLSQLITKVNDMTDKLEV